MGNDYNGLTEEKEGSALVKSSFYPRVIKGIGLVDHTDQLTKLLRAEPNIPSNIDGTEMNSALRGLDIVEHTDLLSNYKTPRFFILEEYEQHIHRVHHGPGPLIKTFSLFPGEETEIEIETYTKSEEQLKESRTYFDEISEEKLNELNTKIEEELKKTSGSNVTSKWGTSASANAQGTIKLFSVGGKVSANRSGRTEETRSTISRALDAATRKQLDQSSRVRRVEISSESSSSSSQGRSDRVLRKLSNINLKASLNFFYRQVIEHYVCILQLSNVRFVYLNADGKKEISAGYSDLDVLLTAITDFDKKNDQKVRVIREYIDAHLSEILNYDGQVESLLDKNNLSYNQISIKGLEALPSRAPSTEEMPEEVPEEGPKISLTVDLSRKSHRRLKTKFDNIKFAPQVAPGSQVEFNLSGIPLSISQYQLATDGVIVKAITGDGKALDEYSESLQVERNRSEKIDNDKFQIRNDLIKLLSKKIEASNDLTEIKEYVTLVSELVGSGAAENKGDQGE